MTHQRDAWERSREVRHVRCELRRHVESGGCLTLLLTARHSEELDGVRINRLIRWIPGVARATANSALVGLPSEAKLGELDPIQFGTFVRRVREIELRLITSQFHNQKG